MAVASDDNMSDKAAKLAVKHREESGIVFDVRWPISHRHLPATTESVTCVGIQRGFLGRRVFFYRHRFDRRKPVFMPMRAGRYTLTLCSTGHGHSDEATLVVDVDRTHPQVITCWPAKRRVLSPERHTTKWVVQRTLKD